MNVLKRIESEFQESPATIMQRLGISKSYYSMIKNEKTPVSKNLAIRIYQAYGISLEDSLMPFGVHEPPTGDLCPTGAEQTS